MNADKHFEQMEFDQDINTFNQKSSPLFFPMHWHHYVEVVAVPEDVNPTDTVVIRINHNEYVLHSGDLLFIWPGELHEVTDNSNQCMIGLQFPGPLLTDRKEFAKIMTIYKRYHLFSFEKDATRNQQILFSLQQMLHLSDETRGPFHNIEMLTHLYEIFIILGTDLLLAEQERSTSETPNDSMVQKIHNSCTYIQDHCEEPLTLDSVANYVGFSPCYFSRYFKKVTSYNFVEYLMMQRVKRMQMLLTNNSLSITDAAYQAGFKSISTLNRVFRQYSGCSPSEYRKYYRV